ncbi:MAG: histidine phosphatase family protein, partial [Candidatus Binatia bacterium]
GKHYRDTPYGSGNTIEAERVPGMEPSAALYDRVKRALEHIHELPGTHILVVCHNGTGRMLRTVYSDGKPIEMYDQPRLENAVMHPLDGTELT